ncbi:MAG: serine/threonine protein kinase [Phycisphaerales bacterium]|nr:serine/threonine protein kinase [Phycisphaerales bacterium]
MHPPGRAALQIFEAIAAAPAAERGARLADLCAGNARLRAEVERLVRFDLPELAEDPPTLPRASEVADLPVGEQLGSFAILGVLGRGTHGTVYRARQERPPREVALKVLACADDPSVRRRFETEIAAQARLNHPGIVQVYEVGMAEGTSGLFGFLAMELVADGVRLLEHVRARSPDRRARLELLVRIADALDHAHQRGILHRDLKPDNILVVADDDGGAPKLLDFGVAHAREAIGLTPGFAGTPAYCAPEQVHGDGDIWDVRSDVYSLGVVACEVLTGELPIDVRGVDPVTALARMATERVRLPGTFDARLRGDVDSIVGKALARQPEQRYASAREFAADVRRHLRREPVLARRGGVAYRFGRHVLRHPARMVGVLALVALIGVMVGAWIHRHAQTRWALEVVKSVLATAIDGMGRLPGTAHARGECLDQLLAQMAPVVTAQPADPHVLAVHADLLRGRGHVARDLGDWERALAWRRRGLAVRETLAGLDPRPEVESELAEDIVLVGDVYQTRAPSPRRGRGTSGRTSTSWRWRRASRSRGGPSTTWAAAAIGW